MLHRPTGNEEPAPSGLFRVLTVEQPDFALHQQNPALC
jgi:hypothetical protein